MPAFGERGQRLWDNFLHRDETLNDEMNPTREIAISACRTADIVDDLELRCKFAEPMIMKVGGEVINPLFVECRNQQMHLARMVAALRMPDPEKMSRPQQRSIRGAAPHLNEMSALERARAAKAG